MVRLAPGILSATLRGKMAAMLILTGILTVIVLRDTSQDVAMLRSKTPKTQTSKGGVKWERRATVAGTDHFCSSRQTASTSKVTVRRVPIKDNNIADTCALCMRRGTLDLA